MSRNSRLRVEALEDRSVPAAAIGALWANPCLLYTSPSPRDS